VVLSAAMRQVEAPGMRDRYAHVLAGNDWHAGVIGIVASRIVEATARPAVLVAVDQGIGKGSGRSISAFDLHAALKECRTHFTRFGGHRAAAGLTMDAANLPAFAEQFDSVARARLREEDLVPEIRIDMDIPIESVGDELEKLIRHFEPFGIGNAAPMFRSAGVRMTAPPRKVGTDGLRLSLDVEQRTLEAIGWGMASHAASLDVARAVDVAYRLERDEYRGVSRLQLKLCDLKG